MTFVEVIVLSLVEGLTEFLPISSTGHLIIVSSLFPQSDPTFTQNFNIIIQFGAILAVVFEYRKRLLLDRRLYKLLFFGFLPAAAIGFLLKNKIDQLLGSVTVVAIALIAGGVVLVTIDKWLNVKSNRKIEELKIPDVLQIGLVQCFALVPGVSRAAATIIGGQLRGLNLVAATEFSFLLAVPTISAAALYKTAKVIPQITSDQTLHLVAGVVLSFVFALAAIRFFIRFVGRFGLKYFGYYRMVLGAIVLLI